ncbi:bifunctional metallophosphatase/5'-nucleotidase [Janthinobacterium agaricidamnosum]|nr:bifunctional metallophosphatase/5'-nucleotidase [Janthinobacterium agaricidamnosum]
MRFTTLAALAPLLALSACVTLSPPVAPLEINLVALNDFHGNLDSSTFSYTSAAGKADTVRAGGIDTLSGALAAWRREDPQLIFVGNGDLVGASPAMSSMWADEPSIVAMNMLGMKASSVGNHEFDQGRLELLRQQNGGCDSPRPDKACQYRPDYRGAQFTYLAANVIDSSTGKPFMPAYRIEQAHGIKVAFIGAVLRDTASVVVPSGIAGLQFIDEADAINRVLPELRAQGVGVFVVLLHQGGNTIDAVDQTDCNHLTGPVVAVAQRIDPAVRLVISGHSHQGYLCRVGGKLVTQAEMGGHMLSRIKLSIDPASNRVRDVSASNVVMQQGAYAPDPAVSAYLQAVKQRSKAELSRPVARIASSTVSNDPAGSGESALGDVVADSTLFGARASGAQIAFMNNGGIRTNLEAGAGSVASLGQTQMVLPFGNTLVLMDLSGAQIRRLLEQQWQDAEASDGGLLQVSDGFSYRWDSQRPLGARVLPDSIKLHGVALDDRQSYRVVANSFLAEGGDKFSIFAEGKARLDSGVRDIDALNDYLTDQARRGKPAGLATPAGRIQRAP